MPGKRIAKRVANDWYRTPVWVIDALLGAWAPEPPRTILEPCAGDGALLAPMRENWPDATIDAYDIEPKHPAVQRRAFWSDDTPIRYDLVLTNPPYAAAEELLNYALSVTNDGGHVALLLRDSFLSSVGRAASFRRNMPLRKLTLAQRPSFNGGGTDWSASAWFIWKKGARRRWYRGEVI